MPPGLHRPPGPSLVGRAVLALVALGAPAAAADRTSTPVATLEVVRGGAELRGPTGGWHAARDGTRVATGDGLRTDAGGLARLRFPWMSLSLGPATRLSLDASRILSAQLEEGRLEQSSARGILKLRTPEVEVRGQGHLVLRREQGRTLVSVMAGAFRLRAGRQGLELHGGQGAVVVKGTAPEGPLALPAAPQGLHPDADPRYVPRGAPVSLSWSGGRSRHHVQVLGAVDDELVAALDVEGSPVRVEADALGTFRWRVASRDARGLEGQPSADGVFCVVEK